MPQIFRLRRGNYLFVCVDWQCNYTGRYRVLKTKSQWASAFYEKPKSVAMQVSLKTNLPTVFAYHEKQKRVEIRNNVVGIPLIPKLSRAFVHYVKQERVNLEIRINTIGIPLIPKWQRAFAPYVKQKRIGIWICAAADPFTTQVWGFGSPPVFLAPQGRQNWRNTAKTKCGRRPPDARSTLF